MKFLKTGFLFLFFICFIFSLKIMQPVETNLVSAFISQSSNKKAAIIKLSEVSNKRVNILIETNTKEENENIKEEIENIVSNLNENEDIKGVLEVYKNYPANFLTKETETFLKKGEYKKLEEKSLAMLYNPLGIYISPPDKDPFLFATDFVLNNQKLSNENLVEKNGKIYSTVGFSVKNKNDLEKLKEEIKNLEFENSNIYLTGSPVHSLETAKNSSLQINIICILSFFVITVLCLICFHSPKILVPVFISIIFGGLFGFTFSALIFKKLHVLTFVFSTSLIGISLDYSLHYYISGKNKEFKKSLLTSLLSTVLMFGILYFSNLEILRQIAVFVAFGLFGVYFFVNLFLPELSFDFVNFKPFDLMKYKKIIIAVLFVIIGFGAFKLHFNDDIKTLYTPSKALLQAEVLYKNVFKNDFKFYIFEGENVDKILEKEENAVYNSNMKFIGLNSFISSTKKQKENLELVQGLYKKRLNTYADFLDNKSKSNILKEKKIYDPNNFPLSKTFMIDENSSFMMADGTIDGVKTINVTDEMTKIIKEFKNKVLLFMPVIFLVLILILKIFYTTKQVITLIVPSFLGGISALFLVSVFDSLNVFHLLAFILSLGFSMDYSIFRLNGGKNSSLAVLISSISTVFSFLMLSFVGFKPISSLGIVLSIGIFTSYILSLAFIKGDEVENI